MRSSASVRSSTTAVSSKRPSSSKIGTPAAPQAIDQRDDYIVNLKVRWATLRSSPYTPDPPSHPV